MQQPTHSRLHLRDAHDAHVVFEAVRQGFLIPVARRLNEMERSNLVRSGAVFVWFEAEDDTGLMRWTDGRAWGQSRMREPYLFYDEKTPYDTARVANETSRGPTYRFVDGTPRSGPASSAISHQDRTIHHHSGLVKQAYSAWVTVNPYARPQKWHITAYFTYNDLPQLPTIEHDPVLRKIIVPTGIYRSSHSRTRGDSGGDKGDESVHNIRPGNAEPHPHVLPSLATLAVGGHPPSTSPPRPSAPHGARLPEDQRLIHMLNSRHIR
ncbi:Gti1/Pac2 family-domain-containing protein [Crepidotus variabilis]|uniref:Gti1/Pac2 family-domain-containing protein n=1 Tax=Crepidotus variabilis TaxID=179855 RepID=A0A9P6EN24_9AGAR|nr:Gti1/Pac2 family-domain-containing protein [Crepidotus variabilis]